MSSEVKHDLSGTNRPDFTTKDAEAFEYLCLDIARAITPDVISGDLHERGTAQNGVDFLVESSSLGLIAGSCRSDEDPSRGRIIGAAKEFAASWESLWRDQGVTKFILCLACEARQSARKKSISDARKIILNLGIECEIWSESELIDYLRPHPSVVIQHLDVSWARKLCVPDTLRPGEALEEFVDGLNRQIEAYKASQEPLLKSRIESLSTLARQGARQRAAYEASQLKADGLLWLNANAEQKATIVRTTVIHKMDKMDEHVRSALNDANTLCPPKDRYFDLKALAVSAGIEAALKALAHPRTLRERTLKAAFVLQSGDPGTVLSILDEISAAIRDSSWAMRLRSIAFAMLGDFDAAIAAAEKSVLAAPDDIYSRQNRAVVYLNAGLSPSIGFIGSYHPDPYVRGMVRQDKVSQDRRQKSMTWLADLASSAPERADRETAWLWWFIGTIDDENKTQPLEGFICDAKANDCLHPYCFNWLLARGIKFDQSDAIAWLTARLELDAQDVSAAIALFYLGREQGDVELLEQWRLMYTSAFEQLGPEKLGSVDVEITEIRRSKSAPSIPAKLLNDDEIEEFFLDHSSDPGGRLHAAQHLAGIERWDCLIQHKEFLLNEIGTPVAFEIVAHAISATVDPKKGLQFFEEHKSTYLTDPISPHYQRMHIGFLANAGRLPDALAKAETVWLDPKDPNYLIRAQYQLSLGNARGAGQLVQRALAAGNVRLLNPETQMRWANTLAPDDPTTAIKLLDSSFGADPDVATCCGAAFLALQLVPNRAEPFIAHMQSYSLANPDGPIRPATLEETRDWMISLNDETRRNKSHYGKGYVFGHAVWGDNLGLIYLTPHQSKVNFDSISPHIAHASNGREKQLDIEEVILDSSAMLIADILRLWPYIEQAGIDIILPDGWPSALFAMERAARPSQSSRISAMRQVIDALENDDLRALRQRSAGSHAISLDQKETRPATISVADLGETTENDFFPTTRCFYLYEGVAEYLAERGDLGAFLSTHKVRISSKELIRIKQELQVAENGVAVADQIKVIRQYLSSEMRSGRIQQSPTILDLQMMDGDCPPEHILKTALCYSSQKRSALWVDDRFMTGHLSTANLPIIGVLSILELLKTKNAISEHEQSALKHRLRALGYDHILPSADDVYEALLLEWPKRQKPAARLIAMRRSFERFVERQEDIFGPPNPHAADERQAGFEQYLLASHIIQRILERSLGSREVDQSAILWVVDAFRMDWRPGMEPAGAKQVCEMWYGSVVIAFLIHTGQVSEERRAEFKEILESVYLNLVKPAIEVYSGGLERFSGRISSIIEKHLLTSLKSKADINEVRAGLDLVSAFLDVCPTEIEDILIKNPTIRTALRVTSGIGVMDLFFFGDDLWTAVDALIASSEPVERQDDHGRVITLSRLDNEYIQAAYDDHTHEHFIHPAVGGMTKEIRRDAFDAVLGNIRFCKTERTRFRRRFAQLRSAERRAHLIDTLSHTPEGQIHKLERLKPRDVFHVADLSAPEFPVIWRWLAGDADQNCALEGTYEGLVQVVGPEEACLRWSGVPVELPDAARYWIRDLAESDKERLAQRLFSECIDPVSRRNLMVLFSEYPSCHAYVAEAHRRAGSEATEVRIAQLNFAKATALRLCSQSPPDIPLDKIWICAWAWTGRLFSRLIPKRAALVDLAAQFLEREQSNRLSLRAHLAPVDMLNPKSVSPAQFCAALAQRFLSICDVEPTSEAILAISTEISYNGEGLKPVADVLNLALQPNAHSSWINHDPRWVIELLDSKDPLLIELLQFRDRYLDKVFAEPNLSLEQVCMVGPNDFDPARNNRVLKSVPRWMRGADLMQLKIISMALLSLNPHDQEQSDRTVSRALRVFSQAANLIGDDAELVPDLYFFLEATLRVVLQNRALNVAELQGLFAEYELAVWGAHRDELAVFICLVADLIPITERAPLLKMAAQTAGAAFP